VPAAGREIPLPRALTAGLLGLCAIVGLIAGKDPILAIGAAIGAVFILLAFTNLGLALVIFCGEPMDLDFSSSKVVRIGAILLLIAWLTYLRGRREKGSIFTANPSLGWAVLIFLGWVLLSITWAAIPSQALIQAGGYAMGAAILAIAYTAVDSRRELPYLVGVLLLGIFGTGAYAFISSPAESAEAAERLSGTVDPNVLAAILITGAVMSVGVGALWRKRSPVLQYTAYGIGLFCLAAVFLTVSRGGLIALFASLLAGVVFGGRWRARVALLGIVVALGSAYYIVALAPNASRERILNTVQGQEQVEQGRTTIWQVALRMGEAHPVNGVGAGNFPTSAKHYLLQPGVLPRTDLILDTPKVAHNIYLQIWAELGLVGLVLFLLIVFFALRTMFQAARNFRERDDQAAEVFARSLLVATIGMLVASFFISIELDKHLWLLLGLGPALLHISRRQPGRTEDSVREPSRMPVARPAAAIGRG
jgi:O-antigen ligase